MPTLQKMSIFENYYKRIVFPEENCCYWMKYHKKDQWLFTVKLAEKRSDPRNAKEHYQSFVRKKNTKSIKQSKIITYQPKTFDNPNIIKSVIIEHPKTSRKLYKAIII